MMNFFLETMPLDFYLKNILTTVNMHDVYLDEHGVFVNASYLWSHNERWGQAEVTPRRLEANVRMSVQRVEKKRFIIGVESRF